MRCVVDASMASVWFLPGEDSSLAVELLHRAREPESVIVVPQLWATEMANVLLTATRAGRITESDLSEAAGVPLV